MVKVPDLKIDVVLPHRCLLGEGPVWDEKNKTICWIDIVNGEIHEYSPGGKSHKTIRVDQMIGAITICDDGNFVAALKNGFGSINRENGSVTMVVNPESLATPATGLMMVNVTLPAVLGRNNVAHG